MYESHFQLRQAPFSIAPDPEFLYLSDGHREALAHLTYGLTQGGFVLITGEVGTGKTTLLRNLLKQMPPEVEVAFILNPRLTVRELLETLCDELGIDYSRTDRSSVKQYIDALNAHLLETHASGRSTVVIIDEAQNLAPAVLEQIRLLTNLETDKRKLLRIILLGQPELLELLARKELRQLAQRITARYHLRGLGREDTFAYVVHRLKRAGGSALIFTRPALGRMYRLSGGIPRIINLIADRALLGTYAEGRHRVGWSMIGRAAHEVLGLGNRTWRWIGAGAAIAALAALFAAWILSPPGGFLHPEHSQPPGAAEAPAAAEVKPAPTAVRPSDSAAPPEGGADAIPGSRADTLSGGAADAPSGRDATPGPAAVDAAGSADSDRLGAAPDWIEPNDSGAASAAASAAGSAYQADAPGSGPFIPVTIADSGAAPPATDQTADRNASIAVQDDLPDAATAAGLAVPGPADAPASAPTHAVQPTALKRPDMTTFQTQRLAYQAAFARWGADFTSASLSTIPCDFAPTAGLECLGGTGTWNDLRRLDLPAVLELWDADPQPFYGALVALSGNQATLSIGGIEYQADIAGLGDHWFGGYVLVWKPPPDYTGALQQGARHPSVAWVRGQLEGLQLAVPGTADRDAFDPGLRDAVMRFQDSESMVPDGVVGPQTWIRLEKRIGLPQPRLSD